MYNSITKNQWLKKLQIPPKAVPDVFVIHGSMLFNKRIQEIKRFLHQSHVIKNLPIVLGKFKQKKVGIAVAYGGSMASEFAHIFSVLGAKVIIQTGTFGGLTSKLKPGDCCIPNAVFPGDGASQYYITKKTALLHTNGQLNKLLAQQLRSENISFCSEKIFTTAAMLAESEQDIKLLQQQEYCGIDLETAATLAAAQAFKIPCASLLRMGENLSLNQNNVTTPIPKTHVTNHVLWRTVLAAGVEYVGRSK